MRDPLGFLKSQFVANCENNEGRPSGDMKYEIFEQCHSAEKCKKGDFLSSILLQIMETLAKGILFACKCVDEILVYTCATCIECSLYVLCTVELSNDN